MGGVLAGSLASPGLLALDLTSVIGGASATGNGWLWIRRSPRPCDLVPRCPRLRPPRPRCCLATVAGPVQKGTSYDYSQVKSARRSDLAMKTFGYALLFPMICSFHFWIQSSFHQERRKYPRDYFRTDKYISRLSSYWSKISTKIAHIYESLCIDVFCGDLKPQQVPRLVEQHQGHVPRPWPSSAVNLEARDLAPCDALRAGVPDERQPSQRICWASIELKEQTIPHTPGSAASHSAARPSKCCDCAPDTWLYALEARYQLEQIQWLAWLERCVAWHWCRGTCQEHPWWREWNPWMDQCRPSWQRHETVDNRGLAHAMWNNIQTHLNSGANETSTIHIKPATDKCTVRLRDTNQDGLLGLEISDALASELRMGQGQFCVKTHARQLTSIS